MYHGTASNPSNAAHASMPTTPNCELQFFPRNNDPYQRPINSSHPHQRPPSYQSRRNEDNIHFASHYQNLPPGYVKPQRQPPPTYKENVRQYPSHLNSHTPPPSYSTSHPQHLLSNYQPSPPQPHHPNPSSLHGTSRNPRQSEAGASRYDGQNRQPPSDYMNGPAKNVHWLTARQMEQRYCYTNKAMSPDSSIQGERSPRQASVESMQIADRSDDIAIMAARSTSTRFRPQCTVLRRIGCRAIIIIGLLVFAVVAIIATVVAMVISTR